MTGDDLDALLESALAGGEEIHPSLRFRSAVMDSVRASAQPPIPFPWRRLGLAGAVAAVAGLLAWELPPVAGGPPALSAVWFLPLVLLAVLAAQITAAVAGDGG